MNKETGGLTKKGEQSQELAEALKIMLRAATKKQQK